MDGRYGLVYLGSKEKILNLIDYILHREQDKEYLIDLFAGGLSVSAFALKHSNMRVISNDLNKYIIAFYEEIIFNGGRNFREKKYDWVDRKLFTDVRNYPEFYPDWYIGYVLNIWSFACNQKDYIYAKEIEEPKKALHQAIVFKDYSLMNSIPMFNGFYDKFIKNHYVEETDYKTTTARRVVFFERFKKFIDSKYPDKKAQEELQRLGLMVNLTLLEKVEAISDLIYHKERITLFTDDWKQIYDSIPKEVLEKSVIYCDPPYEDTKEYKFGSGFNYVQFWNWFRECPYPVYVSSYRAPLDIQPINFEKKVQMLDNGHIGDNKPKKKVFENIYWNGKGNKSPTLLDMLFGK
jgi:site-specific DNA-adenine methylase